MKKEGKIKQMILSALLPLLMVGCAGEDIDKSDEGTGNDPVKQHIIVTTVIDDDASTRGTPVTSANAMTEMTDFGFFCSYTGANSWDTSAKPNKMFNVKMTRVNGTAFWEYDGGASVEWGNPDDPNSSSAADRYTFFAYAPYATAVNGISVISTENSAGVPQLRYSVPANAANQPDLMIARSRKNIHPTGHPVGLQMKHALTSIGFMLSGSGNVTGISITGVYVDASISMDTTTYSMCADTVVWNISGNITSGFYPAVLNGTCTLTSTPQNPLATNGYLMMIPQQLTSAAQVKISFSSGPDRLFDLTGGSLPDTWEPGKKMIYSINL